jgi:hypothetical protein
MSSIYWAPALKPASEVKIQRHENKATEKVVNFILLISIEEFLVLIDFCQFGNLKSYLTKNRNHFMNQLNGSGDMQPENEMAEINTIAK